MKILEHLDEMFAMHEALGYRVVSFTETPSHWDAMYAELSGCATVGAEKLDCRTYPTRADTEFIYKGVLVKKGPIGKMPRFEFVRCQREED